MIALALFVVLFQQPAPKPAVSAPPQDQQKLADLVAHSEGQYTKLGEGAWNVVYRGKNMPNFSIKIVTAEGGVFFFVHLFDKTTTMSRAMLLKVAELNSQYDYVKIDLADDGLEARLDSRLKLMDLDEFKKHEAQIAIVADQAYGVLKDFIQ